MWPAATLKRFRADLLAWFSREKRDLPWRRTKDPYAIWISEIMLQQTRVAAAVPYFERFLRRFPTYQTLAEASEDDVLNYWAGLGYYHRARNMKKAATLMCELGNFPGNREAILKLPGVGDYTAAAVASIAFDLPHAVIDGNVRRVISRLFVSNAGLEKLAGELLDHERPGDFNQAVMELGATLCLPKNPQCLLCPVAKMCQARAQGVQHEFPAKKTKPKNVEIERTLLWVERGSKVLAWQRPASVRLMPGFWELPEEAQLPGAVPVAEAGVLRHCITVNRYRIKVWRAEAPSDIGNCQWIEMRGGPHLPLSTIFKKALKIVEDVREPLRALKTTVGN
jgi:A/G-specific adenine glycosylase